METFVVSDQLGSIAAVGILIDSMWNQDGVTSAPRSPGGSLLNMLRHYCLSVRACVREMLQMLHRRCALLPPPSLFYLYATYASCATDLPGFRSDYMLTPCHISIINLSVASCQRCRRQSVVSLLGSNIVLNLSCWTF